MAEYNTQSIDIDLEEMFNGLSKEDQEEFLVDMFQNLSDEDSRKSVVGDISGILKSTILSTSLCKHSIAWTSTDRKKQPSASQAY